MIKGNKIRVGLMYYDNLHSSPINPNVTSGWSNAKDEDDEDTIIARHLIPDGRFEVFNLSHKDVVGLSCSQLTNLKTGEKRSSQNLNQDLDIIIFRSFGPPDVERADLDKIDLMLTTFEQKLEIKTINPVKTVHKYWKEGKEYLLDLARKGVALPETYLITKESELSTIPFNEYVIKPVQGFGGFCVQKFPGGDLEQVKSVLKNDGRMLVQKFVPQIQTLGERSLVFFHDVPAYAFVKIPKEGEFRTNYSRWCSLALYQPSAEEVALGRVAIEKMGIESVLTRVDMSGPTNKPVLIEITRSCTGMYPRELKQENMIMQHFIKSVYREAIK